MNLLKKIVGGISRFFTLQPDSYQDEKEAFFAGARRRAPRSIKHRIPAKPTTCPPWPCGRIPRVSLKRVRRINPLFDQILQISRG